jgi:putative addiction module CopG family antidote
MKTYTVTLPDEFAAFVDRMIAEGVWDDVDTVILAAVSRLQSEVQEGEEMTPAEFEALRKEVQIGIDQADRGELLDGPTVMAELLARYEAAPVRPK